MGSAWEAVVAEDTHHRLVGLEARNRELRLQCLTTDCEMGQWVAKDGAEKGTVRSEGADIEHLLADNQRMWEELQFLKKASVGFVRLHDAQIQALESEILGMSQQLGRCW